MNLFKDCQTNDYKVKNWNRSHNVKYFMININWHEQNKKQLRLHKQSKTEITLIKGFTRNLSVTKNHVSCFVGVICKEKGVID